MRRWLLAVLAALVVIAAGYLVFVNGEPDVAVRWAPDRIVRAPLGLALLAAFVAGGLVVGLVAGINASGRAWTRWREARTARRAAARAAVTSRAERLVWSGDYEQARTEILRAEGGVPADVARLALVAETHLHEGEPAAARKLLEDGMTRAGAAPRLLDLLAEACERGGDLTAAAAALERARTLEPESPRLARRLRDLYAAGGRWADALALQGEIMLRVRDAGVLAAERDVARGLRYEAALAEPDHRRAARLLAALAREEPRFVPAWVAAGDRFAAAGRRLAARRTWERGARATGSAILLDRLERLYTSEGRPERAARVLRRLVGRTPAASVARLMLARHLLGEGALDEAEAVLQGLPAEVVDHPLVLALRADAQRRRGNHTVAAETYAQAAGTGLGLDGAYRCEACREVTDAWTGRCPDCGRWGTMRAAVERVAAA
jgi:tetratricopeptide (TPR) repeat protein